MVNLYNKIKTMPYKVELFLQVHDALFCYVEEKYAEEWAKIQQSIMEETGRQFITLVPVKSDITISSYWSK